MLTWHIPKTTNECCWLLQCSVKKLAKLPLSWIWMSVAMTNILWRQYTVQYAFPIPPPFLLSVTSHTIIIHVQAVWLLHFLVWHCHLSQFWKQWQQLLPRKELATWLTVWPFNGAPWREPWMCVMWLFFSKSNYSLLFSPADSVCGIIVCCWV